MPNKRKKTDMIIDQAIIVLKSEGDFGISMRKIAGLCDMSLSNLQYYFKNKDNLLKAMADKYFQQCLNELSQLPSIDTEEQVFALISAKLSQLNELSDMCRIFREYWAISTRNSVIDTYLVTYYQRAVDILATKLKPLAADPKYSLAASAMLMTLIEGYSVTAKSMPMPAGNVAHLSSNMVCAILRGDENGI